MIRKKWIIWIGCALLSSLPTLAQVPKVVVSIAPLHSLVTSIMHGVATPELLLSSKQSPHHFYLSPSQTQKIAQADLVIWVGDVLETFLIKPLETYHKQHCALVQSPQLKILHPRGKGCQDHCIDPHIWLDIENAEVIADKIAQSLCDIDAENAQLYLHNAAALKVRLHNLKDEILTHAQSLQGLQFICLHDAFQYYEQMVGVRNVGVIASTHSLEPSLKHIHELKELLRTESVTCAFSEPQSQSVLLNKLAQEFKIQSGLIDPLGANIAPGIDHYFLLLKNITQAFLTCAQNKHATPKP